VGGARLRRKRWLASGPDAERADSNTIPERTGNQDAIRDGASLAALWPI
jgi:hypothetical protein